MNPLRHIPPYDFQYRFTVDRTFSGRTLIEFYTDRFGFKPREYWEDLIFRGESTVNEQDVIPTQILQTGDIVRTWRRDVTEPPVNDELEILCDTGGLFILNKRAPIPVHPSGRYFKNSLTTILRERFPGRAFHTIHRLDLWTTGVLLLATDERMAKILHGQVEKQKMKKAYGVLAVGNFGDKPFKIDVPVGRVQGAHRGYGEGITEARNCVTEFTPLLTNNQITFLKAEPLTGRTNQIRVHVKAAGGSILNDPLYSPNPPREDEIDFMGLHCRQMDFITGTDMPFCAKANWPEGFLRYFSKDELDESFDKNKN